MSINPPSDHYDTAPLGRLAHGVEVLSAAWCQLPPPAKLLFSAAALRLAAPALRRAADILTIQPSELLQLVQRT
jgi:hypothetical protein